jgi:hypothetical protein
MQVTSTEPRRGEWRSLPGDSNPTDSSITEEVPWLRLFSTSASLDMTGIERGGISHWAEAYFG